MKAMVTTQFNDLREKYIFGRPYIYHIVLSGLQSTMSGQKQDMMEISPTSFIVGRRLRGQKNVFFLPNSACSPDIILFILRLQMVSIQQIRRRHQFKT